MTEPLDPDRFQKFWDKGYHRLIPIVPPGADLNPNSSLQKRIDINIKHDPRGKVPGNKRGDGLWSGIDFVKYESTADMLPIWAEMGAGVGIKTGHGPGMKYGIYLIDADTLNATSAAIIGEEIKRHFGPLMYSRIGNFPKAGFVFRCEEILTYRRIEFGERDAKNRPQDRVEILGGGRQFVACGIHPKTMRPYSWPSGVPDFDDIPILTVASIDAFLRAVAARVPQSSAVKVEGGGADVDQWHLKDKVERVQRAVQALPNKEALFPSREDWLNVGYAIKAATQDDPEAGLGIFQEWSDRYDGVSEEVDDEFGFPLAYNDEEYVAAEWERMQPPFRRGADWLYELVKRHGGTGPDDPIKMIGAERWIEEGNEERSEDFFPPEPGTKAAMLAVGAFDLAGRKYRIKTLDDILNAPSPKFLIDRHVPEKGVGLLYAAPGAGKTFIAFDMALCLAYGLPTWHGDAIDTRGEKVCVIYLAGEGASGFKARSAAWLKVHGLSDAPRGRFGLIDDSIDFMDVEQVATVVRTLRADTGCRVAMIVVDTVSRVLPGADENLQKDMTLFVAACDRLRDAFNCVVLGVHHTNKSGEMRGSSVIPGAGDFIFSFERKRGASVGTLACIKMKERPDGWEDRYRLNLVDLSEIEEGMSSLVPERCEIGDGEDAPVEATAKLTKPQKIFLDLAIEAVAASDGQTVAFEALRQPFYDRLTRSGASSEPRSLQLAFRRAKDALVSAGLVFGRSVDNGLHLAVAEGAV